MNDVTTLRAAAQGLWLRYHERPEWAWHQGPDGWYPQRNTERENLLRQLRAVLVEAGALPPAGESECAMEVTPLPGGQYGDGWLCEVPGLCLLAVRTGATLRPGVPRRCIVRVTANTRPLHPGQFSAIACASAPLGVFFASARSWVRS